MVRLAHFLREELIMQGHEVIENRLVAFHQKTRHERITFRRGATPQRASIIAFGDISEVAHHGWTHTTHVDRLYAELLKDVIALNVAEDHRRTRFRGVFFELPQHRVALTAWYLEEVVDRAWQRRGQGRSHAVSISSCTRMVTDATSSASVDGAGRI